MKTARKKFNRGVSITELIVAVAILIILMSAVGRFAGYVNRAVESRDLICLMRWELENAREQIGSWQPDEITEQRIVALPFSTALAERLQNPVWVTEIQPANIQGINEPTAFHTIRLGITAEYREQPIRPVELYFWIPIKSELSESPGS